MIDEELKKALHWCGGDTCHGCPNEKYYPVKCRQFLASAAYGKISLLENENADLTVKNEVLQRDVENLTRTLEEGGEWKHMAEMAKTNYKHTKEILIEKIKQLNKTYDVVKLDKKNGEPYEIVCTHCGENIRYYVSAACMYCGAKLSKTKKEIKDKFNEILQLKAFCDKQGIKCVLIRRNEYLKSQDGYKIQFLNGDVIQGTITYGYLEFDGTGKEIDNKRVSIKEAKAFIAKNKNWLSF